jgi:hypothetical protein
MLRGFAGLSPKIAAIDIPSLVTGQAGALPACHILGFTNLTAAAPQSWQPGPTWPDGVPYVDGGVDLEGSTPALGPSCAAAAAAADGGAPAEAGAKLAVTPGAESAPLFVATRDDFPIVYVADSMLPLIHVVDVSDPASPKELDPLLATSVVNPTRSVTVGQLAVSPVTSQFTHPSGRASRYLYAIDQGEGSLMVYDVTDPLDGPRSPMERPHPELNPFVDPDRIAFSAPVATLTFAMHDWPLANQAAVAAGTSPTPYYSGLMCNPNPNAHPDAGVFLDNGAYYRVDQAGLIQTNGTADFFPGRLRGVFGFATLSNGTIVAIDVDDWDAPCRRPDPMATTNVTDLGGVMYTPANLYGQTGSLAVSQPDASGPNDFSPYHAPITYNSLISESSAVTQEAFFPVSAPNRVRSGSLLLNDPLSGNHMPNVQGAPQLFNLNGSSLPTGTSSPLILATALPSGWYDPSFVSNPSEPNPPSRLATSNLASAALEKNTDLVPGGPLTGATADGGALPSGDGGMASAVTSGASIRISLDDPTAHQDQDWTVTYEGQLPSVSGITGVLSSPDNKYETLTLAAPNSSLCERGIEDVRIGRARAQEVIEHLGGAGFVDQMGNPLTMDVTPPQDPVLGNQGVPPNLSLADWTGDYVQITDDLLANTDMYWQQPVSTAQGTPNNACWDGALADDSNPNIAQARYNACDAVFGTTGDASFNVNTSYARDFPIVQAFDDHLVLGRFYWPPTDNKGNQVSEQTTNRIVVGPDPGSASSLRFAQCCFHSQAGFAVRTGGEWVASGSSVGLIHHVQTDPATGACVLSCDPRLALANARSFDIPWAQYPTQNGNSQICNMPPSNVQPPDRNSVLAMRNPIFSYVTWSGCGPPGTSVDHTTTSRDDQWRFSIRGSFSPLTISLTQGTNTPVSPQSSLFIPPLGQIAVVDGQLQGLVLIDLNTLQFAHAPYF